MDDIKLPKNPFLMTEEEQEQELQKQGFSSFKERSLYSSVIKVLYFHPKITKEDFSKISRVRTKSEYDKMIKKYDIEYVLKEYSNMNGEEKELFNYNVKKEYLHILREKQASVEKAIKYIEERIQRKSKELSKNKYDLGHNNYSNPFKNNNPFEIDERELDLEAKEKGFNSIYEQDYYEDIIFLCIKLNPNIDSSIINWNMFKTKEQQHTLIKQYGFEEILNKYLKLDSDDARTSFKINMIAKYSTSSEYDYKPKTHK